MIGTIGDWLNFAAALIKPLYQAHKLAVCNCNYLNADETSVKVLDQLKKETTHIGYTMGMKVNLFYLITEPGRGQSRPKNILKNYKCCLNTDEYTV